MTNQSKSKWFVFTRSKKRLRIRILGFFSLFLLLLAIPATIILVKMQTQQNSNAAPATSLSFSPISQPIQTNSTFTTNVIMDPGKNHVALVKLLILYDSQYVTLDDLSQVEINKKAFPVVLEEPYAETCEGTMCKIGLIVSTIDYAQHAITQPTTVASFTFNTKQKTATEQPAKIVFDQSTQAFSVSQATAQNTNVISSLNPLEVTIE